MSSFPEGQTHQLMESLERDGWTPTEVTALGQLAKAEKDLIKLFLAGVAQIVLCLKLSLGKLFVPAEFIGKDWSVWKGPIDGDGLKGDEDRDVRENRLHEIDWEKVEIINFLRDNESSVLAEENLLRQKQLDVIRLGGRSFRSLWDDYHAKKAKGKPEESILERLRLTKGIEFISFFGLVLRTPDGGRCVLYLCWNDGEWSWDCLWLGFHWAAINVSAILASV